MESKRKHGFLKAALPAFAMLLVAVLSLTTVTFAWFTQGDSATVDTFELDVAAGGGLEISTTGEAGTWKSTLTKEDLASIEAIQNFAPTGDQKLAPVSTVGTIGSDGVIAFFSADIEDSTAHKITSTVKTTEGYLSFALYFRNAAGEAKKICINGTTFSEPVPSEPRPEPDTTPKSYAHLATRLAFVNSGSHNVNAVDSSFTGGKTSGTAFIFEPNATDHTDDGINDYKLNGPEAERGSFEGKTAIGYFGVKGECSEPDGISRYEAKSDVLEAVTPTAATEEFFELAANSVTKITVYIWIEGQDADCTNTISSNAFSANLKFEVKKEAP